MESDLYKRLSHVELMTEKLKDELDETLFKAYDNAVKDGNVEEASELVRRIRNKKLDTSDKEMALDRIGIDTTNVTKFLNSFIKIFSNDWSIYRQELRDIPQQPGFPMNVSFPKPPNFKGGELLINGDNNEREAV